MEFEEALKLWGQKQLQEQYPDVEITPESVTVDQDLDTSDGCDTCGYGSSNGQFEIYGYGPDQRYCRKVREADWSTVTREIIEIGGGLSGAKRSFSEIADEIESWQS